MGRKIRAMKCKVQADNPARELIELAIDVDCLLSECGYRTVLWGLVQVLIA